MRTKHPWHNRRPLQNSPMYIEGRPGKYDLHIVCRECKLPWLTWVGYCDHMAQHHPTATRIADPRPARTRHQTEGVMSKSQQTAY